MESMSTSVPGMEAWIGRVRPVNQSNAYYGIQNSLAKFF